MTGLVTIPISSEQMASQLELASTDVLLEGELASREASASPQAVASLTDSIAGRPAPLAIGPISSSLTVSDQVALVSDVKDKAKELWSDIGGWLDKVFRGAEDKLKALAEKVIDVGKKLGVSVEQVVGRLYRRVMQSLVENSVLPPFAISDGDQSVSFKPNQLKFSFTLKAAPALASLDVTGVMKLLSGLMGLEFSVEADYGLT